MRHTVDYLIQRCTPYTLMGQGLRKLMWSLLKITTDKRHILGIQAIDRAYQSMNDDVLTRNVAAPIATRRLGMSDHGKGCAVETRRGVMGMKRRSFVQMLLGLPLAVTLGGCDTALPDERDRETSQGFVDDDASYEDTLFDASVVHRIDVSILDEDWSDLLENPVDKTKYHVDVAIDGETLDDVAFSTKGNSSLVFVAADPDCYRYSFKLSFGKYVDGQTYRGLDKLCLNNGISDATYMKDHISYGLFRKAGVPAPLSSSAWVTINGDDLGLYVAVEDLNDSFVGRALGGAGTIYKPESGDLGLTMDMVDDIKENGLDTTTHPRGADFVYTDDDSASYPDIFENAETDAGEGGAQNIIAAMRCLAEGRDPSPYIDTDEAIRFFAAHNYILNYDSYLGPMLHNLALCENDDMMSLVPWDYNLAYGAFIPVVGEAVLDDATDILNRGIDSPLIGVKEDARPLWKWIVQDDVYREEYHGVLGLLIAEYFESGEFEGEVDELSQLILPFVEKDPTAFFTTDEFEIGCETFKVFCMLRAESVRKQLSGSLSTWSDRQDNQYKVDASGIHIDDMGAAIA